ncbi:MAG: hypothetical protein FI707_01385 [SAR202 cluster bacterium]|nr:hypothetical protein [Chloroflexota bacterium]MQG56641.1 hypothetical protein [SAR202 cluster bacterium]MQG67430.1 hypothetical protein [SAR202 cluster bacterium]HAL48920.1 hypothetical protein [Dehalococcoidia bacterium]
MPVAAGGCAGAGAGAGAGAAAGAVAAGAGAAAGAVGAGAAAGVSSSSSSAPQATNIMASETIPATKANIAVDLLVFQKLITYPPSKLLGSCRLNEMRRSLCRLKAAFCRGNQMI